MKLNFNNFTYVINSFIKESSPGPDGFTYSFYKLFIKECIPILIRMFNLFLNGKEIPKVMKSTKIILLYKKNDSTNLDNWRPISLTNCDIKIFTKILANRLNIIAQKSISRFQYGFIKGRSIIDNIQYVNGCINHNNLKKNSNCIDSEIVFLDQKKAFDRVNINWLKKK